MIRSALLSLAAGALVAAPAWAGTPCAQSFKDTEAMSKTNDVGPKEVAKVADMLKQADELCKAGNDAQANEILRQARLTMGE